VWYHRAPAAKTPNPRLHFHLRAWGSVGAVAARLVGLGASVIGGGGDLVVMADPEGNEFCVEA
jgi:hypothetical protein